MEIKIHMADDAEWTTVHRLIREAFLEYEGVLTPPSGALRETADTIREKTAGRGGAVIVQDADRHPVGTALYYFIDAYMYIGRVSVIPSARGKGVGKMLLSFLENFAREADVFETRVEVRLSIPDNIALYRKMGYEPIDHIFYPEGTDSWYVMKKTL